MFNVHSEKQVSAYGARSHGLRISRYVSTAVPEPKVDLQAVHTELTDLEKKIAAGTKKHNAFLKELGLKPLP